MPDSIDLARYSVFTPPDPFEDHVGPFYFLIDGDASKAGSVHCVLPTEGRHGNYRGGVHGGAIWVEDGAGRGGCFCVRLPIARLPLSEAAGPPLGAPRGGLAV